MKSEFKLNTVVVNSLSHFTWSVAYLYNEDDDADEFPKKRKYDADEAPWNRVVPLEQKRVYR